MVNDMPTGKDSLKQERQVSAESGLILLDHSFKVVAFDKGAAGILKDQAQSARSTHASCYLPKEILNTVRNSKITTISSLRMYMHVGKHEYSCRAFLLEWQNWLSSQPMIAIHLEKVSSSTDAIYDIGIKYQLTNREQEVLRGISLGLSSKVMAHRMEISPNTVKAFLRLIMIKMGVTSRAGIVANILNRTTLDNSIAHEMAAPAYEAKAMAAAKGNSDGTGPAGRQNGSEARGN